MLDVPDFLIPGAAKSGTTSLHHYLKQHPGIYMPVRKEPWFFAVAGSSALDDPIFEGVNPVATAEGYRLAFADAGPSQLRGEASTIYLHRQRETIRNILRLHEDPRRIRVVILLRDPTDRAFSHWLYDVREGHMTMGYREAIAACAAGEISPYRDYVEFGRYHEPVRAWTEQFPHTKVWLFEELVEDPAAMVREILTFLGADPTVPIDTGFVANVSGVPRFRRLVDYLLYPRTLKDLVKGVLPEEVRVRLKASLLRPLLRRPAPDPEIQDGLRHLYRDDIARLEELLARDLSSWKP